MHTNSHTRGRRILAFAPELAVLILATVLRLITLGSRDYWHDEIHDILKAQHLKQVLLEGELVSNHPPLFSVLARIWGTFGDYDNEWYMRALPMILGVCGVGAIYLLARTLIDRRAALFAALLLAVSPLHVVHSQDFKVYILLPFTGTIAGLLLYLAMRDNRNRIWAGYAVMAAVACYSDLFAAPLLVSLNVWALARIAMRPTWRNRLPPLLLANFAGAVLYLPQLALMLRRAQVIMIEAPFWWVPPPDLAKVYYVYKSAAFGYSDTAPALHMALLFFTALVLFGGWIAWRKNRAAAALLIVWSLLSILQLYLVSHIGNSVFLIRATIPYLVPLWVFAGTAIAAFSRPAARWAVAATMIALLAVPLVEHYTDHYPILEYPHRPGIHPPMEYRAATEHILQNWREGDIVVHTTNATWYPMYLYGLRNMPSFHGAVQTSYVRYFLGANPRNNTQPDLVDYWPVLVPELVKDAQRVWLVFSEWERMWMRGDEDFPSNPTQVWRWLEAHSAQTHYTAMGELEIFRYEYNRGDPPPVVARDHDDGATARVTYGEPLSATTTIVRPDNSLLFQPLPERATGLTVNFSDGAGGTAIDLTQEPARRRAFTIENRGDAPAKCRVEVVAAGLVVDLATLDEKNPGQDQGVWAVSGVYHDGPPRLIGNLTAPVPRPVEQVQQGSLVGEVAVAEGTYRPLVYLYGPGGDSLSLTIDGNETLPNTPLTIEAGAPAGRWVWGTPVDLSAGTAELALTARRTGDEPFQSTAAYLALVPIAAAPSVTESGAPLQQGVLNVTIPPGKVAVFEAGQHRSTTRLDVWVHELGDIPRVYRIFTHEDEEPVAGLATR